MQKIIIIFTVGLLSMHLQGQEQNSVLKKIINKNKTIHTIESDFLQVKHISFFEDSLVSTGKFFFRRPDKMVWKYEHPFLYAIVINGDSISLRDEKKLRQFDARTNGMFSQIKEVIFNMVSGNMLTDSSYQTHLVKAPLYDIIQFYPKNEMMKKYLTRIDLYFDKKTWDVMQIKMNEASGDYTFLYFKNRKTNQPLSNDVFKP